MSNTHRTGAVAPSAQPEGLADPPNPYHRVERLSDRTEVYPTQRLFRKCIAITRLYALLLLLPCGLVAVPLLAVCSDLPDFPVIAAFILLPVAAVGAILLGLWFRDRRALRDCELPLVIGTGGEVSYRGAQIARVSEIAGVQVVRLDFEEGPDCYSVQFVSPAGSKRLLPGGLPVMWYVGTGQGYFGGWSDRAVAELLARDLARIMGRALMSTDEVKTA